MAGTSDWSANEGSDRSNAAVKYAQNPIEIKPSKVGSLHTALGVPQGKKIPATKLTIKSTDSPALKKKKVFAKNAKGWK